MTLYDFRILLETETGTQVSYVSESFASSSETYVTAETLVSRINAMSSCSFVDSRDDSTISIYSPITRFDDNTNMWLSASISSTDIDGKNRAGYESVVFTHTDTKDISDRLYRYKFFGTKVCNILGIPENMWIKPILAQITSDSSKSNYLRGDLTVRRLGVQRDLQLSPLSRIRGYVNIDSSYSDLYITFYSGSTQGLMIGYDDDNNVYEIKNNDPTRQFKIYDVISISGHSVAGTLSVPGSNIKTSTNDSNTFLGKLSGDSSTLTGINNTGIGMGSMTSLSSGNSNTALGYSALGLDQTGSGNVAIGYNAGDIITTGAYNIVIGYNVDPPSATSTYRLNIGDSIKGDLSTGNIEIIGDLTVNSGSSGGVAHTYKALTVESNLNTYIDIISKTDGAGAYGGLMFRNQSTTVGTTNGGILFNHDNTKLQLGANNSISHMVIDSSGAVTKPKQPGFLAYNSNTDTNIAINTWTTIDFNTEVFDNNGDFSTDTFTAPVTGKYLLTAQVTLASIDSAATVYRISITTSNRTYSTYTDVDTIFNSDSGWHSMGQISVVCDMDALDTAYVRILQSTGTAQTDIVGHTTAMLTYFSGFLLG